MTSPKGFLISNRATNYNLRPVIGRKRSITYPHSYTAKGGERNVLVTVEQPWTLANHLMLDIVGNELYRQSHSGQLDNWKCEAVMEHLIEFSPENMRQLSEYKADPDLIKKIPLLNEYLNLEYELDSLYTTDHYLSVEELKRKEAMELQQSDIEAEMGDYRISLMDFGKRHEKIKPRMHTIEFLIDEAIESYWAYFGVGRRRERFSDLLIQTSQATFSFDGFPVRALEDPKAVEIKESKGKKMYKGGQIYNAYVPVTPSSFFQCELEDRICQVQFGSLLGILFSHNILTLNTDWLPKEFLKLHTNAAALYRRFFSVVPSNQPKRLRVKDVFDHFGYPVGGNNDKHLRNITTWLDQLIEVGLLASFEIERRRGKIEYARIHLSYDRVEKAVESAATDEDMTDQLVQTI
jgi:hypothetical protein